MHDSLKPFAGCSDAASLRCAIQALCTEKGIASRVDIWTLAKSGKRQALCFVRTDPAAHEQQLALIPGVTRIGNEMLFIVDLPSEACPPPDPYDQIKMDFRLTPAKARGRAA